MMSYFVSISTRNVQNLKRWTVSQVILNMTSVLIDALITRVTLLVSALQINTYVVTLMGMFH